MMECNTVTQPEKITDAFILSALSGQSEPTPCTVTAACAGYLIG